MRGRGVLLTAGVAAAAVVLAGCAGDDGVSVPSAPPTSPATATTGTPAPSPTPTPPPEPPPSPVRWV
ncbi:hypothetical protein E1212_21120, partial [Jiangella ureilytica]